MPNEELQGYIVMESTMEPMKPKIIRHVNEPNLFYVRFETCLQSFDCFNRNKRNYSLNAMIEGFKAPHITELLQKGTLVGENGHPDSQDIKRILTIDPTKICHRICDYEFRGKLLYGTIETLNDEGYGKQMAMHVLQGLHPSFSLRALAPITKLSDGRSLIKAKPHIVTYDRVILPSHKEAYMDNSKQVELITSTTESYNPLGEQLNPAHENTFADIAFPVKENSVLEALEFVKTESKRVKELATFFNSTFEKVTLVDENTVRIEEEDGTKLFVYLEDYIAHDIANFFTKLNKNRML